jgi:hypothetical protein
LLRWSMLVHAPTEGGVEMPQPPLDAIGISSVLIPVLRLLDYNGSFLRSVSIFSCVIHSRDSLVFV